MNLDRLDAYLMPAVCLLWAAVGLYYWMRLKRRVGSRGRNVSMLLLHGALAVINLILWTGKIE